MTHHKIRTLPDGTRVYHNSTKYTPLKPEERKYGVNKPDHPDAVRFHALWFLPLPVLPDDQRKKLPETRPDTDAYDHMDRGGGGRASCRCNVCKRPEAQWWKTQWTKDNLKAEGTPDPEATRRKRPLLRAVEKAAGLTRDRNP